MRHFTVTPSKRSTTPEPAEMFLPTGLYQRNGVWQLRILAPAALVHLYPPAGVAYRASLKTRDRAQAITDAHGLIAQHRQTFDAQTTAETLRRSPPVVPLTAELVDYLTAQATRRPLALDDDLRLDPAMAEPLPPGEMLERWHDLQQGVLGLLKADIAAGRLETTQAHAAADLDALGIRVAWDTPDARKALARIARARVKAYALAVERSEGEPHDTPAEPMPPVTTTAPATPSGPVLTLRDVVPDWVAHTKAKPDAKKRMNQALALWEEAMGTVPLDGLTRPVGARFVAYLRDDEARPFGDTTAKKHAAVLNALVNVAVTVGKLDTNRMALRFKAKPGKKRTNWTKEELEAIFDAPLFTGPDQVQPLGIDPADARLWLWVLLWSGATVGEVAQARPQDVQTRDGVLCLHITPDAGTLKTDDRERWVPIAKAVQPYMLAHLEMRRTQGHTRLFPSFHAKQDAPQIGRVSKWLQQFREVAGLPAGALFGSHKFRHTVRTKFGALQVPTDIRDRVTGHAATGSTGQKVYTHDIPAPVLAEAIERLEWQWPRRGE